MDSVLFVSNGGQVACRNHGGMYLQTVTAGRRFREGYEFTTPLDHWTALPALELVLEGLNCEGAGPSPCDTRNKI